MRLIFASAFALLTSTSFASYYSYTCATADGVARWEDGHNDYSIYFNYYDQSDQPRKLTYDFDKVSVKFKNKKTIRIINRDENCYASQDHYFSAHATVTPIKEIEPEFKKAFGKTFTDYVICHYHESGESCR